MLSGSTFAYGPTYFFQQAGISTDNSYQIAVGGTGIAFIGTVCRFKSVRYVVMNIRLMWMCEHR